MNKYELSCKDVFVFCSIHHLMLVGALVPDYLVLSVCVPDPTRFN